ncbi:DJ-1/PfpI family protein [Roseateles sp. DAIF2]|uniref:DJ-1/PfpI family protein n=1 Tax=Roseateles sp. DAIF2 TaxID=2714952 RepID=UPI0035304B6E
MATIKVGIYLFDEVEVLDFAGPFEVFSTAARLALRDGAAEPPFEVATLGPDVTPVRARGGLSVTPQHGFRAAPPLDLLIVPGGVVTAELQRPGLGDWLIAQSLQLKVLASICTGAFLLEQAGLLNEREAITHWEDLDDLRSASLASGSLLKVLANQRWVEARPWVHHGGRCRLFSSAGISAGIDLSLHLVAELAGVELARRTARQMDYDWRAANGAIIHAAGG